MKMNGRNDTPRENMFRQIDKAERDSVILYARQIMAQTKCTWGEAIRVAEERIAKERR